MLWIMEQCERIAMHNPATIDPNQPNEFVELPPVKPPGILYDSVGYNSTVERIRRLANETNSQVWFGHDSVQCKSFKKWTEGYDE